MHERATLEALSSYELAARLGCPRGHTTDRRRRFRRTAAAVMAAAAEGTRSGRPDRAAERAAAFVRDAALLVTGSPRAVRALLDPEARKALRRLLAALAEASDET